MRGGVFDICMECNVKVSKIGDNFELEYLCNGTISSCFPPSSSPGMSVLDMNSLQV